MAHSTSPNRIPPGPPADASTVPSSSDPGGPLLVDCDTCRMRDTDACSDCVVAVLLADGPLVLDGEEREALDALAGAGLVPRLRLVPGSSPDAEDGDRTV
jgi:hypothetical protein